ncbi:MAG: TonB-dependent receptor [Bacteroidetes bacterium]|nr:MAG: TonB-dependent receptor [Bacteroidota bacterium]
MKQHLLLVLLLVLGVGAFAQRTVSGTVTDGRSGEPLEGVTVLVKGTTSGEFTDSEGKFSFEVPADAASLLVSYLGFRTLEVPITGETLSIVLEEDVISMDEVIITGYGSQIKRELTGNIAKVSGEEIANMPVNSIEQAMQGRAAGVFIETGNGKPGSLTRIRIRGASSVGASNQPLYVIDGVPIVSDPQNDPGDASFNPLADFNFNDVESVEILKDASAAAIYGSRASNGVVLITTKRGSAGVTSFNVNLQGGVSDPTGSREFLNSQEFVDYYEQAAIGGGKYDYRLYPDDWTDEQEAIDFYLGTYWTRRMNRYAGHSDWETGETETDWQQEAFQRGGFRQADVNVSGGNQKTRFYLSGSYSKQQGIIIASDLERVSGRINLDHSVNDKLSFGLTMSLSRVMTNRADDDNQFSTPLQLVALAPITPTRDLDGVLYDRPTTTYYNGLIEAQDALKQLTTYRNLVNTYIQYNIVSGLSIKGELGLDLYTLNDEKYWGRRTLTGLANNGFASSRWSQSFNYNTKAYLNYSKTLSEAHSINAIAGIEFQETQVKATSISAQQFPVDDLKTIFSAATITAGSSTINPYNFLSYFARVNYGYKQRYLLTLSARSDGSSRFGANNRFGFFPAASVGWVLSEESFLDGLDALSFLKLRASYGRTGNAAIGNFEHLGLYGPISYNNQSGLAPTQIPNPDLQWEKSDQLDIGIDFGLFNDRITGELDYYNKNTFDLLLDVPVPSTTGFTTQLQNIGSMNNRGFEVLINSRNLAGDFSWNTSFNFARNINEVTNLGEQDIIDEGSSRYMNVVKVGEPIGVFYGAEYAGVDTETGDAIWYKNTEENGVVDRTVTSDYNEAQFVVLGTPNPDFIGGITNTFSYKGVELSFMFQGVYGNSIHNAAGGFMSCNACWFDNQTRDQLSAWKNVGDVTNVPEARIGWSNGDQSRSSRYLSDGSYLRLKNLSLAYDFPKSVVQRLHMSSLRIYANGVNLLTFTNYDGWDPEVTTDFLGGNINSGVDFYAAPQPRTITAGIKLGL